MLNVHGDHQEYGVNYLETYATVVPWFSIRTLFTIAIINKWHSRQVDFIQAYPQAPIEYDLFMDLPKGFNTKDSDGWTHVLQLIKNLYGQNRDGCIWNHHLKDALRYIGFKQSTVDE